MSYVYLIKCGDLPYYKIGISDSPSERLDAIQKCNPLPLSLLMICGLSSRTAASQAELQIHLKLKPHNIHGEWFELSREQVEILKCDMAKASD